jgi:hypothetical protein
MFLGPLNNPIACLLINSLSMIALWQASTSLTSLAILAVVNGLTNGGFFSSMHTIIGNMFGSARVSITMNMMLTGWVKGYLVVSVLDPA